MRCIELFDQPARQRKERPNSRVLAGKCYNNTGNRLAIATLIMLAFCNPRITEADVFDVTIANVTTRAFSVVWVSDEPVISASLRVFADADGVS